MPRKKQSPNIRLTQTDKERIQVAKDLGVFTLEAFMIAAEISKGAAKAWLHRFCGRGPRYRYLYPVKLADGRTLYHFTALGCRLFDLPPHLAKPLGPQARIEKVAALDFIFSDRSGKREFKAAKKMRQALKISDRHLARNFYIEQRPDGDHIGVIFAGTGAPSDRVEAVLRFVQKALSHDMLLNLMKDPRKPLDLAVLVRNRAHQTKVRKLLPKALMDEFAEVLSKLLEQDVEEPPFTLLVEVLPRLCPLITALETQRSQRKTR